MAYTVDQLTTRLFACVLLGASINYAILPWFRQWLGADVTAVASQEGSEYSSTTREQSRCTSAARGIEHTIGNTPLIKIKSLSDATGSEILAKAEVGQPCQHRVQPFDVKSSF